LVTPALGLALARSRAGRLQQVEGSQARTCPKSAVQPQFTAHRLRQPMRCPERFAIAVLSLLAFTTAHAQELARPVHPAGEQAHACLNQKDRRAEIESGRVIRLSTALHAAKARMQGTLVQARLCHGRDGLVYVLTVLGRDGKVARITVDAVKGAVIGGL
jgi:uncharacterized membrane protein YkoI